MRRFITLIFILFIVEVNTQAQSCLPEGITFTTQSQVDSFQANYPGCTQVEGDVTIQEYGYDFRIYDLSGLNVLTSIGGDLSIIDNYYLTSLNGLNNLKFISGSLFIEGTIYGNPYLTSLSGLRLRLMNAKRESACCSYELKVYP